MLTSERCVKLFSLIFILEQDENYDSSSSHSAEDESEPSYDHSTIFVESILLPQRRPISDERVSNHLK